MVKMSAVEKYSQSEVVSCWQNLSREGLQKAEAEMVARYLPSEGRLLDVGCGPGRAVLALSRAGYRVIGLDVSLPMLAAGRRLSAQMPLNGANLLALPLADRTFEATVMFFGALQHIPGRPNRRRALAEMARVTRPRGRMIIGLDNLAPALVCYGFWLVAKLRPRGPAQRRTAATQADATLWSRQSRAVNPLVWHARGLARSLRWRTWPGLVDRFRLLWPWPGLAEPGDTQVAQFSLQATPGQIYYHIYQTRELMEDAAGAGWRLLGHHSGTELSEGRIYPPLIRQQDKQQFFAFERGE